MKKTLIVGIVLSLCFATSVLAGGRYHHKQSKRPKVIVIRVVTHSPSVSWYGQRMHRNWDHSRQQYQSPRQYYRHRSRQPTCYRGPMKERLRHAVRNGHSWSPRHGYLRSRGHERVFCSRHRQRRHSDFQQRGNRHDRQQYCNHGCR